MPPRVDPLEANLIIIRLQSDMLTARVQTHLGQ